MARKAQHEDGEGRREALVAAAYHLIAKEGLEGLRTRDIADQVGVNIATLHYYFPKKEDLIHGVVDYVRDIFRLETEAMPPDLSPLDEIRAQFDRIQIRLRETPEIFAVLMEFSLRAQRDEATRIRVQQLHRSWRERIRGILVQGIEQGQFSPDIDVHTIAAAMTGYIMGTTIQTLISPDEIDIQQVYQSFERMLR